MTLFEEKFVENVYNKISKHFSATRVKIWPKVQDFINTFNKNSKILDIGCGNSKNMGTREDCNYIGIDICENFIKNAPKKSNCQYIHANCLNIPLENNSFDNIISIAVIHHLSTYDRRLKAIEEIYRLLKNNGTALVYVWSYEQPKFINENKQDVFVKWSLKEEYNQENKNEIIYRYYHLFVKNELEELINKFNFEIIENGIQHNNYYCIIKKTIN